MKISSLHCSQNVKMNLAIVLSERKLERSILNALVNDSEARTIEKCKDVRVEDLVEIKNGERSLGMQ